MAGMSTAFTDAQYDADLPEEQEHFLEHQLE